MAGKCSVDGCLCEKYEEPERKESKGRNWWKPLAIGGGCAVGGLALSPIVVPATLSFVGFTSSGVAAGSIAAWMMSVVGNVTAGGVIATMQSIGAARLAATGTAVGGAVGGASGFVVSTAVGAGKDDSKKDKKCSCDKACNNCHHCKCRHLR